MQFYWQLFCTFFGVFLFFVMYLELYHKIRIPAISDLTDNDGTKYNKFTIKPDYVLIYCEEGLENIDNKYWQIFINERATIIDENWCYGSTKDISVP